MAYAMTKQGSLDNCVTYEFICDAVEDMNAIEDRYRTIGSIAIVLQGASGLEVYISGSDKQWNSLSSIGGGTAGNTAGLAIHICAQDEVSNGLPDIELPDETTIYLVPASDVSSGNLYDEYIYVDDEWEKFGSGGNNIDLSDYVTQNDLSNYLSLTQDGTLILGHDEKIPTVQYSNWQPNTKYTEGTIVKYENEYYKATTDYTSGNTFSTEMWGFQPISDPFKYSLIIGSGSPQYQTNSVSIGNLNNIALGPGNATGIESLALAGTASGLLSIALGEGVVASGVSSIALGRWGVNSSGYVSHAEGQSATASGPFSYSRGTSVVSSGRCAHVEGDNLEGRGDYVYVLGRNNVVDPIYTTSDWNSSTSYQVGDVVTYNNQLWQCNTSHSNIYPSISPYAPSVWTPLCSNSKMAFIVGNGYSIGAKSNAYALDWDGNAYFKGNLYVNCQADSTGGTKVDISKLASCITTNDIQVDNIVKKDGDLGFYLTLGGERVGTKGFYSATLGEGAIATCSNQTVIGKYNIADGLPEWIPGHSYSIGDKVSYREEWYNCITANNDEQFIWDNWEFIDDYSPYEKYICIAGNGTVEWRLGQSTEHRSNAYALDWSGNGHYMGDIYVGCNADSTGGTKLPRIPEAPSTDGVYTLQATVSNGTVTYSWITGA